MKKYKEVLKMASFKVNNNELEVRNDKDLIVFDINTKQVIELNNSVVTSKNEDFMNFLIEEALEGFNLKEIEFILS